MRTQSDFTEGKILGPLLKFSLPVLFAMLLQAMYGAADLLIVGQFGAAADVSAVSTGSQIMQTITSVITGLSMGTTILLGQKIGQKKPEEAGNVIGAGVCIFAVLALFLTAAMTLFAGPFCAAMQAPFSLLPTTCWAASSGGWGIPKRPCLRYLSPVSAIFWEICCSSPYFIWPQPGPPWPQYWRRPSAWSCVSWWSEEEGFPFPFPGKTSGFTGR